MICIQSSSIVWSSSQSGCLPFSSCVPAWLPEFCLVPPELLVSVSGYIRYLQCRWRRGAAPVKLALSHWGLVLAEIWFNNNHRWKGDDVSRSTPYSPRFCVYIRVCVCVCVCVWACVYICNVCVCGGRENGGKKSPLNFISTSNTCTFLSG